MNKKKSPQKGKPLEKSRQKALEPSSEDTQRRDPKTNVYIPTDGEVAEAKAWSEFCKL